MTVHLFTKSYFLACAEDADNFIHHASVWFNAAISSSKSWADVENGSGFVGIDELKSHSRFTLGNCQIFKFWGIRKRKEGQKGGVLPFAMYIVVIKRLGQAMITVNLGNCHLVPFACCAWGMFEHWLRDYPSIQAIDERMLLFRRVVTQCRLPISHTVIEQCPSMPVFFESLLNDGLILSEFGSMCEYSKKQFKENIQGLVFADQLVKVMPKEFVANIDCCHKNYESCYSIPYHRGELSCDEREARDFMSAVAKRLTILSMTPLQSDIKELRKSEVARRELRGLKHKSKRKRTDLLRSRTQAMLLRGDMNNLDNKGRIIDELVADVDYEATSHAIIQNKPSSSKPLKAQPRPKQNPKTCFSQLEPETRTMKQNRSEPLANTLAQYCSEHQFHSLATFNTNTFFDIEVKVDATIFFDEWDRRMEARELAAMPTEVDCLKAEVERLSQIKVELEHRLESTEVMLHESESSLRDQRGQIEQLVEALSERGSALSSDDLTCLAMFVAEPTHTISASEALRTAEILSGGRLVVLPSARKSAQEVPSGFHGGSRLLQLLMRLTQLWLPEYLASGDAVARNVFTNNTYSAKETRVLQNTKRLVQARTFKYRGREIPMMKHLCIGVKRDTSKTLRVYFEADQEEGKVIVGWCGEHLPVACRLART